MSSHREKKQEFIPVTADRTREELIFAVLSLPVETDRRIRNLVNMLNDLPDIYTCSSCGGHSDPENRENAVPEGCFYIQFIVEPTEKGFLSLGIIDLAARTIDHDNLAVQVLNCTDNPNLVMFHVLGKNQAKPDEVAKEILALCTTWGLPLSGVREYKNTVRKQIAATRMHRPD